MFPQSAENFPHLRDMTPLPLCPCEQVPHEQVGVFTVPAANVPYRNELRFGVDAGPGPNVPIAKLASMFFGDVLRFGIDERPYLVALQPTAREIVHHGVLVVETR